MIGNLRKSHFKRNDLPPQKNLIPSRKGRKTGGASNLSSGLWPDGQNPNRVDDDKSVRTLIADANLNSAVLFHVVLTDFDKRLLEGGRSFLVDQN